ncbi:MAG: hypothetical protein PHY73_00620 [Candidatus Omnitrophica bacterium]|nr:hypothetical protein [Candidatus Omnitrophota bacterium]
MLLKIKQKTAQSTLEYAVLIVIIIGALIAMRTYFQTGLQGKIKSSTDDISSEQFEYGHTRYNKTTNTFSNSYEQSVAGETYSDFFQPETTNVDVYTNTYDELIAPPPILDGQSDKTKDGYGKEKKE